MFTSFGDIVSKVLGFSTETKSDVGTYLRQYKYYTRH
ncbi:Variable outer membrane protein (plasmid) [Borrelia nietonii YOR]|uniref:Variable large protein n=1 Tax=Borrelia nietonii YOR TaxID=1293576 RepID=W5SBQ1_9SPIR|nr:Variable outer membrane protein [Borrelia nietonii YOR]